MTLVYVPAAAALLGAALFLLPRSAFLSRKGRGQTPVIMSEEFLLGESSERALHNKKMLVAYAAMFVGMMGTAAYRSIRSGSAGLASIGPEILLSALVSPIVFRATMLGVGGVAGSDWWSIALSAYQSGFFWEVVFPEVKSTIIKPV